MIAILLTVAAGHVDAEGADFAGNVGGVGNNAFW